MFDARQLLDQVMGGLSPDSRGAPPDRARRRGQQVARGNC